MQYDATAHTANYSINVFKEVIEGRLTSCRLWPADLNCYFHLGGNLKSEVYSNYPHTFDELKHNIC
jgi:hypothetical protein